MGSVFYWDLVRSYRRQSSWWPRLSYLAVLSVTLVAVFLLTLWAGGPAHRMCGETSRAFYPFLNLCQLAVALLLGSAYGGSLAEEKACATFPFLLLTDHQH